MKINNLGFKILKESEGLGKVSYPVEDYSPQQNLVVLQPAVGEEVNSDPW